MAPIDEEAWAERLAPGHRRRTGAYFTPAWVVEEVLDACAPLLPPRFQVVDPSCGAGSFLAAAAARWPKAALRGLELNAASAKACGARVARAQIAVGDALGDGWARLLRSLGPEPELWVGNPPYNGRSAALDRPSTFEALQRLVARPLPKGTSLRDDFAFFLLKAAHRLAEKGGVLVFVTSATLLDSFLYGPVREELLERLCLRHVRELPEGTFRGTRVRTCFTVWTSGRTARRPRYRGPAGEAHAFEVRAPQWRLRPLGGDAEALDRRFRAEGEPLEVLVPVSFAGLKTRFDELLVDAEPERLLARVDAFLRARDLERFAIDWQISRALGAKLQALGRSLPRGLRAERARVRRFHHWRGEGFVPSWCYLDRRLIPRGDHRLRGEYDPHLGEVKLVFNARELPLRAAVLDQPGCVPAWRHTRFAPLTLPRRVRDEGLKVASALSATEREDLVPNLSARGRAWAERLGGPRQVFEAIARFIGSDEVQRVWAPAFGAAGTLHVPLG